MDVIFVEPCFPANQREFVRALHSVGARVIGIGERPKSALDEGLQHWLTHYEQIGNVTNEAELEKTVRWIQGKANVQRLEAVVEAHVMAAARVRERCGIPGTTERTALLCRDKPLMKEALRKAGIPCAASIGSGDPAEIRAFAEQVGFPVIVKPRDAAGASGTYRADNLAELAEALETCGVGRGRSVAVEEFIEGHEGFYDTITIDGEVAFDFVSHYYPNVLDAMRTRWISPQFVATNRIDAAPAYEEVRAMGKKVIEALGIGTSATHMEWFFGPKGLKFSEIGCRPPGVRAWDLYAAGNEIDIYREWAMAVVHGRRSRAPSRRFAAGIIALRPECDGRITGYDGGDEVHRRFGEYILDSHLPPPGTPTQPVSAGYMANAWVRMVHPDYDTLRSMLDFVGQTLKVRSA
ncbi:Carbamoylphosphate synthase large subunit protein [Labilithrix luteola]|uniref:Carbamoylphosphate synthase large subunit protein n=1 Tax=Labilithrix luteola TaxID=1391654 RepID=A0A0K1QF62_9BACT|nr:ATP-grasp domain-containing protein [Labilithrix luteola]AKV04075.1 Carbamoylphosphate synthase large subunit protein [Labilithrix luteola]